MRIEATLWHLCVTCLCVYLLSHQCLGVRCISIFVVISIGNEYVYVFLFTLYYHNITIMCKMLRVFVWFLFWFHGWNGYTFSPLFCSVFFRSINMPTQALVSVSPVFKQDEFNSQGATLCSRFVRLCAHNVQLLCWWCYNKDARSHADFALYAIKRMLHLCSRIPGGVLCGLVCVSANAINSRLIFNCPIPHTRTHTLRRRVSAKVGPKKHAHSRFVGECRFAIECYVRGISYWDGSNVSLLVARLYVPCFVLGLCDACFCSVCVVMILQCIVSDFSESNWQAENRWHWFIFARGSVLNWFIYRMYIFCIPCRAHACLFCL